MQNLQKEPNERKRILILNSSVSGGGAGKALIELVKALHSHFDLHIALPDKGVIGDQLREAGAKLHCFSFLPERFGRTKIPLPGFLQKPWIESVINVSLFPWVILQLSRLAKKLDVQLVHANHQILVPIAVGIGHVTRKKVTIHSREVIKGRIARRFFRWIVSSSHVVKVLCVSRVAGETYKLLGKNQILLDHIDVQAWQASVENYRLRNEYQISNEKFVVGFVGRVIERKGIDLLLRAFSIAHSKHPDMVLAIVGGNDPGLHRDLLQEYKNLSFELGIAKHVVFVGFAERPAEWIPDFDVLVLPSLDPEPFGLVTIEAIALGVPTLIANNSGAAEQLIDRLDTLQFQTKSVHALARAIETIIEDRHLYETIRKNGIKRVQKLFDTKNRRQDISTIFLNLINQL